MKKVVFFSKNLNIGGMEKALVNLLNALVDYVDITLVLEEKTGTLLSDLNSKIIVKEYRLSKCKIVPIRRAVNLIKRSLWTALNKNKYDFACNYATYSVIGSRLAQIASTNSAYYVHSNYYDLYKGNKDKLDEFFTPHHIENFKHIIFVSNESKNKLIGVYPEIGKKSYVVNNLIAYEEITKLSKEKIDDIFDPKVTNFLAVGRLENESKNLDLMLDAFKNVVRKNVDNKLFVIGEGNYRKKLEEKIDKENLQNNVFLLGEKRNPYPYMAKCDCILFTSNYEGFPVTYLEALVLNKSLMTTVIVSDESIDTKKHFIELTRDEKDISKKMLVFKKQKVKYSLDFAKLNSKKIEMILKMIGVK